MTQISTTFNGIQRSVPGNSVQDGACNEMINLRPKDGVLKPVGYKKFLYAIPKDLTNIISHTVGNTRYFIAYNPVTGAIVSYTTNPSLTSSLANIGANKDIDLRVMGNTVIIVNRTDNKIQYLRYNNTYKFFELPELPIFKFSGRTVLTQHLLTETTLVSPSVTGSDYLDYWDSKYVNSVAKWEKEGYLEGYMLVMYAFELVDQTYIFPSAPQLVYVGNPNFKVTAILKDGSGNNWPQKLTIFSMFRAPGGTAEATDPADYSTRLTAGKLQYVISQSDNYAIYKDVIKGISIFCTYPEQFVRKRTLAEAYTYTDSLTSPPDSVLAWGMEVNEETTLDNMIKKNIFFKVKTIDIDKVKLEASPIDIDIKVSDLKTSDIFPVDSFSHHKITAAANLVYNNRLAMCNIKTLLFNGHSPKALFNTVISGDRYMIEWELSTVDGTKIVRSEPFMIDTTARWPHYVSYPDSRAVKFRLLYNVGYWITMYEHSLTPHNMHNFAFAVIKNGAESYPATPNHTPYIHTLFPGMQNYNVVNNIIIDKNRVQISDPGNPFIFPAKNSYQVGNGEAIDIYSNSDPISQGQFGQYPLIVFCSDGRWALQVGTGESYVTNITPLDGEILARAGAYVNTSKMIAFIDSDYNIKLSAGRDAVKISDPIYWEKDTDLMLLPNFRSATNHDQTCKIVVSLCQVPGFEFIKGAILGYDRDENEILVCNPAYPYYSFVYNINSKMWYKSQFTFKSFINDYPNLIGVQPNYNNEPGCGAYLVNDEEFYYTSDKVTNAPLFQEIYIETMPLKFGADILKQIDRLKLMCEIKTEGQTVFGLLVYGSPDGYNYQFISGTQKFGDVYNMLLSVKGMAMKYYKVIISGTVKVNSSITSLVADVETKMNDKLR